jgi:hypothetical protein
MASVISTPEIQTVNKNVCNAKIGKDERNSKKNVTIVPEERINS